jgi:hypothetical protein
MAAEVGGNRLSEVEERPGKWEMCPLSRACCKVLREGENKLAWAKATRLAVVAVPVVARAVWVQGCKSRCHSLVAVVRVPCRTRAS